MHITIKTKNFDLTPDISEYIEKKVAAFDKLVDSEDTTAKCAVEVGKPSKHHQTGEVFYAEFNVTVAGGLFRTTESAETIYAAIDAAKDDMVRKIRRQKQKELHLLKRGGIKLKEITQRFSERGARLKGFIIRNRRKR